MLLTRLMRWRGRIRQHVTGAAHCSALAAVTALSAIGAQDTRARIGLPGYKNSFPIEDVASPFVLAASKPRAHEAIKAALAELGVPLDRDEPTGAIVGNQSTTARITFAGFRMSRVFDCGSSTMGLNADSFRLSIVFLVLLDADSPTSTKVRIGVIGGGEPVGGSRGQAVQCASTGVLETRLMELAGKHLQSPPHQNLPLQNPPHQNPAHAAD